MTRNLVSIVLILGFVPSARADLILDFSADGSTTELTVPVGGTVDVPVFLRQLTVMTPDISTDPLIVLGLQGDLSGGTATFTAADADSAFEIDDSSVTNSTTATIAGSTFGAGVANTVIPLGTFTVMGNNVGDVTTLSLSDPDPSNSVEDFLTLANSDPFDADVFSPAASIMITTVPESSSFLLLGFVLCGTGIGFVIKKLHRNVR